MSGASILHTTAKCYIDKVINAYITSVLNIRNMKKHIIITSFTFVAVVLSASLVSTARAQVNQVNVSQQVQTSPAYSTYTFNNDLTLGSSGSDVEQLQTWLINNGYSIPSVSSGFVAKGYFGSQTQSALMAYQRSIGLPAYGYFGPMTRVYLNRGGNYDNGGGNGNGGNNNAASFQITRPIGGESWQKGTTQNITWTSPYYFRATYVDIKLVPYYAPCTSQVCPMTAQTGTAQSMLYPYRAPYTIATGISVNQNLYSWNVGGIIPFTPPAANGVYPIPAPNVVPDGQYTIQICQTGTSVCTSSASPFNIYTSGTPVGNTPIINGVDAPTTLAVGQTGTWTVRAIDPLNGTLSYSVTWGDQQAYPMVSGATASSQYLQAQTSTFQHSYSLAGTYTVTFTVRNASGQQIQTTSTVTVTGSSQTGGISITSPIGGEIWNIGENRVISWNANYYNSGNGMEIYPVRIFDIYLVSQGCSYPMTCMTAPQSLAKNVQGTSYTWSVGTMMSNTGTTGSYKMMVCQAGNLSVCGTSNGPFTINSSSYSQTPDINVVSPNGGETWYGGNTQAISVNVTGDASRIGNTITAYLVNSSNVQTYLGNFSTNYGAGLKTFNVTVPSNVPYGSYKVLVYLYSGNVQQAYDSSNNYFTVANNYYPYPVTTPYNDNICPAGYSCTPIVR